MFSYSFSKNHSNKMNGAFYFRSNACVKMGYLTHHLANNVVRKMEQFPLKVNNVVTT